MVAAVGVPGFVKPEMIRPGAVVVSGGITWQGKKLLADVDEACGEVASWITPRLGGVGPTTVAMLLRNTGRGRRAAGRPRLTRRRVYRSDYNLRDRRDSYPEEKNRHVANEETIAAITIALSGASPGGARSPAGATGGLRYTVTVTEFENKAGWYGSWDIGDAWGMVMTEKLNATGKFIVLGEADMRNAAMAEQDLAASGRTAAAALAARRRSPGR